MGIIFDVVLVAILLISAFAGYKVGLVKLGAGLIAGILAIVIAVIAYKPVSEFVINNTQFDEKIENAITENTQKAIEKNVKDENVVTEKINNEIVPNETKNIAQKIIYILLGVIIFIVTKIILRILVSFLDIVAKLPLLKQFNEIGGVAYGLLRGALIVCICVLLLGVYINMKPESGLSQEIEKSYLTKIVYKNIVRF